MNCIDKRVGVSLDAADFRILNALQHEPGLSIAELSEKIGLSATPCWRRLKRLESDGIIVSRATLLNRHLLGMGVCVFAFATLFQHNAETLEAFEEEVSRHEEILECYSLSGDRDYILKVLVDSVESYENFLKNALLKLPGIESVSSTFSLKELKFTVAIPLKMQV